jgi:hypothetical protein
MRSTAVSAPLFLLFYGVLRWIDGRNGRRHDGLAWDAGHVGFLVAMVLFVALACHLRAAAERGRTLATAATAAVVFGAGCILWVITGDLFDHFRTALPLPGSLEIAGPVVFVIGMLILQGLLVADGRLPMWSPLLFFAGFVAISVNLDLLPLGAMLVLAALVPLARGGSGGTGGAGGAGGAVDGSARRAASPQVVDHQRMGRLGALTPATRFAVD